MHTTVLFDTACVLGGSVAALLAARVLADHARTVPVIERNDVSSISSFGRCTKRSRSIVDPYLGTLRGGYDTTTVQGTLTGVMSKAKACSNTGLELRSKHVFVRG